MKQYCRILTILFLVILLLMGCTPSEPSKQTTGAMAEEMNTGARETTEETTVPSTTESAPTTTTENQTVPVEETPHSHQWNLMHTQKPSCTTEGIRLFKCPCGEEKIETVAKQSHDFVGVSCLTGGLCKHCDTVGTPLGHSFSGDSCTRCGVKIAAPVFVLGKELFFDESRDSIIAKMGRPTETILEGDMISLVYAADLSRLTVIQTDNDGLWGVMTFDDQALLQIDSQQITIATLRGWEDMESDAVYSNVGSCRVYGFRDSLGSGQMYAMWMRYQECDYHFAVDSRIFSDYSGQAKLSYYYVNALRAKNGLTPLSWSAAAAQVSAEYSRKMVEENFFAHDYQFGSRLTNAGVMWRSCGENISQGYTSLYFVCDAYYNCNDHRNNILNPQYTHVGMGFCLKNDAYGPVYVLGTQTFYS